VNGSALCELPGFVGAGAIGFAVDASVLTALVAGLGADPYRARGLSFALAVTVTWYLNRRLVFRWRAKQRKIAEYARYVGIQVTGAGINLGIYSLCLQVSTAMRAYPALPLAIGAAGALVFTYFATRRLFRGVESL
jgi:putative flippase GtrA